jgi:hypothetical protein
MTMTTATQVGPSRVRPIFFFGEMAALALRGRAPSTASGADEDDTGADEDDGSDLGDVLPTRPSAASAAAGAATPAPATPRAPLPPTARFSRLPVLTRYGRAHAAAPRRAAPRMHARTADD